MGITTAYRILRHVALSASSRRWPCLTTITETTCELIVLCTDEVDSSKSSRARRHCTVSDGDIWQAACTPSRAQTCGSPDEDDVPRLIHKLNCLQLLEGRACLCKQALIHLSASCCVVYCTFRCTALCRCALSRTRPWLHKEIVTLTVVHKGAHLIILLELVLRGGQIVE